MNKAILLGTSHIIQRGDEQKDSFHSYIAELSKTYEIKAIAEEFDNEWRSVAADVSAKLGITYKIIEPTQEERIDLKIEDVTDIAMKLRFKHKVESWPDEPSIHNLPVNVYEEYTVKAQTTYRQRELEWLRRIYELDTWPVLIICGANHYLPFYELLSEEGIDVVEASKNWVGTKR